MSKSKKMRDHATDLADRLAPHVETARDKAVPMIADAKTLAAPYVAQARDKAAPYVADAREKAGPALSDAKDRLNNDVLPMISAAFAAASDATEDVRGEAKKRGRATAAALMGEVEAPQKKHRIRKLLVVVGLGGVIAAVAKKLSDRKAGTAWQSSYTPPPAPSSPTHAAHQTTTAATGATGETADDEAAATPDEAAADATEAPHSATTPDNPAEEIHLKRD